MSVAVDVACSGSVAAPGRSSPDSSGSTRPEYSLVHLSDASLQHGLLASAARSRAATAQLLAYLAEFDERRLYVPAGYESMRAYCLGKLRLSEDETLKRTQAARIAREFPAIFAAVEQGHLNLSGVVLLARGLRQLQEAGASERCDALLSAAADRTNAQIQELLAVWFPRERRLSEPLGLGTAEGSEAGEHAVRHVAGKDSQPVTGVDAAFVAAGTPEHAAQHVNDVDTWVRVTPLSADRFELRGTIDRETLELLRQNQALLGHQVRSGNMAAVLKRALAASVRRLEQRKFAATDRPRAAKPVAKPRAESSTRPPADPHSVPAPVRRAVWKRDGGRCTYVSPDGHRCESRRRLEYDHIVLACHGGKPTVKNTRLRCQAHNQYTAEQALGVEFMRRKRKQARERRAGVKPAASERARERRAGVTPASERASDTEATTAPRDWIAEARARGATSLLSPREPDVVSALRQLGLRLERARELARICDTIPEAPLEERLRVALSFYGSSLAKPVRPTAAPAA